MANKWNIPDWLETEVRDRDLNCVYCRRAFTSPDISAKTAPSWEHIVNDASIVTRDNIALCCRACNASKGQKSLSDWLASAYCERHGISKDTVADVVKKAIEQGL